MSRTRQARPEPCGRRGTPESRAARTLIRRRGRPTLPQPMQAQGRYVRPESYPDRRGRDPTPTRRPWKKPTARERSGRLRVRRCPMVRATCRCGRPRSGASPSGIRQTHRRSAARRQKEQDRSGPARSRTSPRRGSRGQGRAPYPKAQRRARARRPPQSSREACAPGAESRASGPSAEAVAARAIPAATPTGAKSNRPGKRPVAP